MKLRSKRAETRFFAMDRTTGEEQEIPQQRYLSLEQQEKVGKWPGLCLQFARYIAGEIGEDNPGNLVIRVDTRVSLNGRPPQHLIDPEANLLDLEWGWRPSRWILPLTEPLGPTENVRNGR